MVERDEGCFKYLAGVEVKGAAPLPEGFDGSGLHPQMQAAMPMIWGEMLPKSGRKVATAPDFELYPAGFAPNRQGAYVDIWIPVEA